MSTNENSNYSRLEELTGSKFEIVDGEPDITGWDVKNDRGLNLGDVNNLLFDPKTLKVRYLVIDTDGNDEGIEGRHVLIPIGIAQLRRDDKDVVLPGINSAQLGGLPAYEKGKLTTREEMYIRTIFGNTTVNNTAVPATDYDQDVDEFYAHEDFNEDRFYGNEAYDMDRRNLNRLNAESRDNDAIANLRDNAHRDNIATGDSRPVIEEHENIDQRLSATGRPRITNRWTERPEQENSNLDEKHINIERVPIDRDATAADAAFVNSNVELPEERQAPLFGAKAKDVEDASLGKDIDESVASTPDNDRRADVPVDDLEENRRSNHQGNGLS